MTVLYSNDVLNWIKSRFGSSATITPTEFDVAAKRWIDSIQPGEIPITTNIIQIHEPYILGYTTIEPIYPPYTFVSSTCFVYEYDGQYFQDVKSIKVLNENQIESTLQSLRVQFGIPISCIPSWQCRIPLDGYETDVNNCGEADRYNINCEPICVPNWQCEVDLDGKNTGYKIDINGCFESTYDDVMCPPGEEPPEEPNILFYVIVGGLGLIGLKLISNTKK